MALTLDPRTGPGLAPWRVQIRRTVGGGAPEGLVPGQLAVEMEAPHPRLWVGVPPEVDPALRLLVINSARFDDYLPLVGGHLTGPGHLTIDGRITAAGGMDAYHGVGVFSGEFVVHNALIARTAPGGIEIHGGVRGFGYADFDDIHSRLNVWVPSGQVYALDIFGENIHSYGNLSASGNFHIDGWWHRPGASDFAGIFADPGHRAGLRFHASGVRQYTIGTRSDGVWGIWDDSGLGWRLEIRPSDGVSYFNGQLRTHSAFTADGGIYANGVYPGTSYGLIAQQIAEFRNGLDVTGWQLHVPGALIARVSGGVETHNGLTVHAPAAGHALHVHGYTRIFGTLDADNLGVFGNAQINQDLGVSGNVNAAGGVWTSYLSSTGGLVVLGPATMGPVTATMLHSNTTIGADSNIATNGSISASGTITANGSISANMGDLFAGGNCVIVGDIHVANAVWTVGSNFHVVWDTFITASLVVGGHDINNYVCRINAGAVVGGVNWMRLFGYAEKTGGGEWLPLSSDRRTKTDIAPYRAGLDAIRQLNPCTFRYNGLAETLDDGVTYTGLVAQDVAGVLPEMVLQLPRRFNRTDTTDSWVYTLDYSLLKFALVNAVQELDRENAELKRRLGELEGRVGAGLRN